MSPVDLNTIRGQLAKLRGVAITPRFNREISVLGQGVTLVLREDPSRVGFHFVNLGAFDVFLAPLSQATTSRAVRIQASGGSASAQFDEDGEVVAYEWQAFALGGSSSVFVQEALIERAGVELTP